MVTPLTDDTRTIENLLSALAPDIMPLQGSNATEAIELAAGLLETSGLTNGSVLLITDGLPKFETSRVEGLLGSVGADLGILVMGPTPVLRSRCLMAVFCAMTMTKSLFQPWIDKKFNELPQHSVPGAPMCQLITAIFNLFCQGRNQHYQ